MDIKELAEIIREHYVEPVMANIRETEANMDPVVRAFLGGLPNGHVWEQLRKEREES